MTVDNTIHNQEASMQNLITVIIATKSRWVDLEKALLSLRNQTVQPDVIVMDDNSDDGTSENIKKGFPEVKLYSFKESKGYIVRRNEAIELAQTPYVLSIDDDCILEFQTTIEEIARFCLETKSAAIAWPYINRNTSEDLLSAAPDDGMWQACTFRGCSFIVHKEMFFKAGGFRSTLVHQGEEEDFCIRLLDLGLPVILGKGSPIVHYESPKRSFQRVDFYGSRNLILFALFNVPLVFLPLQLAGSTIKAIIFGFKIKRPYHKTRGVLYGFFDGIKLLKKERRPVDIKTFLKYRELKKQQQQPIL